MPNVNLSNELLNKCGFLLYRAWVETDDNLRTVKKMKYDGTPNWDLVQRERLRRAMEEERLLKKLLDELTPHVPFVTRFKRCR